MTEQKLTPEAEQAIKSFLEPDLSEDQELDIVMKIFERMPVEDGVRLMLHLGKISPAFVDSKFFNMLAKHYEWFALED